jgi:murein DD-endopeptidase MepM/ murein hydrolase activator NlpD
MTKPPRLRFATLLVSVSTLAGLVTALPVQAQVPIITRPTPTPTQTRPPEPEPEPTQTQQPPTGGGGGSTQSPKPPKPPKDPNGGGGGNGGGNSGGSSGGGTRPGRGSGGGSSGSSGSGSSGGSFTGGSSSQGRTPDGTAPVTSGATPWGNAIVVGPPSGGEGGFGLAGWATREKTPPRTTTELLELTARLYGSSPSRAELSRSFGRFPILGQAWFQDDYGAPRAIGRISLHAGNDIFAERGTPVAATIDGYIWKYAKGGRGGYAIWLMGKDGVRYYYGHMERFAFQPRLGRRLQRGEVIGFVGATGSAVGTPPHVHFEVNPGGRGTVNPKPHLDKWLDDAVAAMRKRLDSKGVPSVVGGSAAGWAGILRLLDVPSAEPAPLWMLAIDPSDPSALADDAIDELLAANSWDGFEADPFIGATGPEAEDPFGLGLGSFIGAHAAHGHD